MALPHSRMASSEALSRRVRINVGVASKRAGQPPESFVSCKAEFELEIRMGSRSTRTCTMIMLSPPMLSAHARSVTGKDDLATAEV